MECDAISKEIVDNYGEDILGLLPVRLQRLRKGSLSLSNIIKIFLRKYNGEPENQEKFKMRCAAAEGGIGAHLDNAEDEGEITAEERNHLSNAVNFVEEIPGGRIRVSMLGNIIAEATGYTIPLPVERPGLPPKQRGKNSFEEVLNIMLEDRFTMLKNHGMVNTDGFHINEEGHLQGPEGAIQDANLRPADIEWINTIQGWRERLTPPEGSGDGLSPEEKAIKGGMYTLDAFVSTWNTRDNDNFEGQISPDHPDYVKYTRKRHAGIINIVQNLDSGINGMTSDDLRHMMDELLRMNGGGLTGGQKKQLHAFATQIFSKLKMGNNLGKRLLRDNETIVNRETFQEDIVEALESYNLEEFRRLVDGVIEEGWTTVGCREGRVIETILILVGLTVQTGKSRVCLHNMIYGMARTGAKFGGYMVRDKGGERDAYQLNNTAIEALVAGYEGFKEYVTAECKKRLKPSAFEGLFLTEAPGQPTFWQRYMPEYEAWSEEYEAWNKHFRHNLIDDTLSRVATCTNTYKRYIVIFNANHTQIPKITNWINNRRECGLPVPKSIYCQDEADETQKTNQDITIEGVSTEGCKLTIALYTLIKDSSVEMVLLSTATGAKLIQNFTSMDGVIYFTTVCKRETGDTLMVSVQDATEGKSVAERVKSYARCIKEIFSDNGLDIQGAPLKNAGDQQRQIVQPSRSKDLHTVMTWHSTGGKDCNARAEISGMYVDEFVGLQFDVLNTSFQGTHGAKIIHIRSYSEGDVNAQLANFLQQEGGVSMSERENGLVKFHDGKQIANLYERTNGLSMQVISDLKEYTTSAIRNKVIDAGPTIDALQHIAFDRMERVALVRAQFASTSDNLMIALGEVYIQCAIMVCEIAKNIAESVWQRERDDTTSPTTGHVLHSRVHMTNHIIIQHIRELDEIPNRGSYNHALNNIRSRQKSLTNISIDNATECRSLVEVVNVVSVALSRSRKQLLSMKDIVNTIDSKKRVIGAAMLKQRVGDSQDPLLGAIRKFTKKVTKNTSSRGVRIQNAIKRQTVFEIKVNKTHNPELDLGQLIGMVQVFVRYHLKRALPYIIIPDKTMNRGLSWCINLGRPDNRYFCNMMSYLARHHMGALCGEAPEKVVQDLNYTCPLTGQILDGIENRTMESIEQMIRAATRMNSPTTLFEDKAFLLTTHRSYASLMRANANTEQNMQKVFEYGCHYDGIMANGKKTIHYVNKELQRRVADCTFKECTDQEVLKHMGRVSEECIIRIPKRTRVDTQTEDTHERLAKVKKRFMEKNDTLLNKILNVFIDNRFQPMKLSDIEEKAKHNKIVICDFINWDDDHYRYKVLVRHQDDTYSVREIIREHLEI